MNARQLFFIFLIAFSSVSLKAQYFSSNYTNALGSNTFNKALVSGAYMADKIQSLHPDQISSKFLLTIRRNDMSVNNQFQISTTSQPNDKVYFRKINVSPATGTVTNSWHEIATRGANNFIGAQVVKDGSITIDVGRSFYIGANGGSNKLRAYATNTYSMLSYTDIFYLDRAGTRIMTCNASGNVGIGTTSPKNKLDVNGTIRSKSVLVEATGWADFVFEKDYELPSLYDVSAHIEENQHLPGIPTAQEVKENGIDLAEMNVKLLQKIEELTLYTIRQQTLIDEMQKEIREVKSQINY